MIGSSVDVSVVIPTYNCAEYLGDAVASALSQEGCSLEVLVVDDGSTDDTPLRYHSFPGVRYLYQSKNKGPASARNQGVRIARGKYVAFLDADDAWLPGKLKVQVQLLNRMPHCVGACGLMEHWDRLVIPSRISDADVDFISLHRLVKRCLVNCPTAIIRREAVLDVGGFDESVCMGEDYDLWVRLARKGPFVRLLTNVARYRTRANGLSAGNRDRTYSEFSNYIRSMPTRFADIDRIRLLTRQHLAYWHLDHSFTLADDQQNYANALRMVMLSLIAWPGPLQIAGAPFLRLRRMMYLMGQVIRRRFSFLYE